MSDLGLAATTASRIVDASATPAALLTCDGRILHANGPAARLLDHDQAALLGTSLGALAVDRDGVGAALELWQGSGRVRPAVVVLRSRHDVHVRIRGDGARVGEDVLFVRFLDPTEGVSALERLQLQIEAANLTDLQERLRATMVELERTNQDLESRNQELGRYASAVAHDLRNPLQIMRGTLHVLSARHGARLGADGEQLLDQLGTTVTHMASVIEALLSLANLDVQPPARSQDPTPVVAGLRAGLADELAAIGATLEVGALLPTRISDTHLHSLLGNLLGNAVKFRTTDRPLRIGLHCEAVGDMVRFHVDDNGPGIDDADADRIFDRFDRGTTPPDRPGSGIGLATCRKIADSHGGAITCTRSPLGGARFTVALPADPDPSGAS